MEVDVFSRQNGSWLRLLQAVFAFAFFVCTLYYPLVTTVNGAFSRKQRFQALQDYYIELSE